MRPLVLAVASMLVASCAAPSIAAGGRRQNRLERMRDVNGKGERDTVLLEGIAGADIHDGGRVKFGPDGRLYLTVGEAGNEALAQNVSSPNGKILRLGRDGSRPP